MPAALPVLLLPTCVGVVGNGLRSAALAATTGSKAVPKWGPCAAKPVAGQGEAPTVDMWGWPQPHKLAPQACPHLGSRVKEGMAHVPGTLLTPGILHKRHLGKLKRYQGRPCRTRRALVRGLTGWWSLGRAREQRLWLEYDYQPGRPHWAPPRDPAPTNLGTNTCRDIKLCATPFSLPP